MDNIENKERHEHHDSVQDVEERLISYNLAPPALQELDTAINRTSENQDRRSDHSHKEDTDLSFDVCWNTSCRYCHDGVGLPESELLNGSLLGLKALRSAI